METAQGSTVAEKRTEITKDEYEKRKLTPYGFLSGVFDIVFVFACLFATGFIAQYMTLIEGAEKSAWFAILIVIFVLMLKGIIRFLFARDSYQTVIIREN